MAAETKTGEPATAHDLALRLHRELDGLAALVALATEHGSIDDAADGLSALLKSVAEDAAELLESLKAERKTNV